jgi:hypothetical protein
MDFLQGLKYFISIMLAYVVFMSMFAYMAVTASGWRLPDGTKYRRLKVGESLKTLYNDNVDGQMRFDKDVQNDPNVPISYLDETTYTKQYKSMDNQDLWIGISQTISVVVPLLVARMIYKKHNKHWTKRR